MLRLFSAAVAASREGHHSLRRVEEAAGSTSPRSGNEENEWPREDHTNPFAQPERTGIVRVHQKSQDQPGAKVEPGRRTTAPDRRAHAVHVVFMTVFALSDEPRRSRPQHDFCRVSSSISRRCHFFGQPAKCEVAHTSLPSQLGSYLPSGWFLRWR